MRTAAILSTVLFATLAACAPASEVTDDSGQDLTGGGTTVQSAVVFLWDGANAATPKCIGALINDTMAVTAKSCAKTGLTVGRADDKNGKGKQTTVKALHLVDGDDDAKIAIVELAGKIDGTPVQISNSPLKDGYSVNSYSATEQPGWFNFKADKGESSSVNARLSSQNADGTLAVVPDKDTTICAGDLGAPVCESTAHLGFGTCGLSGLIIAPPDGASNANGGCSAGSWKMEPMSNYIPFLKKYAPKAFEPIGFWKNAAEGMWGYKTGGTVKSCQIVSKNLSSIQVNGTAKVSGKASFKGVTKDSVAFMHIGIAPKSAPDQMTWWPTKATSMTTSDDDLMKASGMAGGVYVPSATTDQEWTVEGTVGAAADGEYVVAFRASGNNGEAWTLCDTAGTTTKLTTDNTVSLLVGNPPSTTTDDAAATAAAAAAASKTTGANSSEYADKSTTAAASENDGTAEDQPVATKKADAGGCSAAPGTNGASSFGIAGVLLGLSALVRRRRTVARS